MAAAGLRPLPGLRSGRTNQSPGNFIREEVGDEIFVIRQNFLHFGPFAAFRVQIVLVEFPNPLKHAFVLFVHQVLVSTVPVRRVKRMIPEHVLGFFRQISSRRLIDVLVMSKREVVWYAKTPSVLYWA
jgi:hypothetical protein